jgi:6-phosphogluconolactonase/glucosamine-6-phosphate isomerase/deaminase
MKELNVRLRKTRKNPVLLMLSGGSSLELLDGIEMRNVGKHITLATLDERVSADPAVNNFSQIAETEFYKKAERKGIDYIDTRLHRAMSVRRFAGKFERGLRAWRKKHPRGLVLCTQGIGEDGHTAGILPYPENPKMFQRLFDESNRWVIGYNAAKGKSDYTKRVTVTLPFLRSQVDCGVAYATGPRKRRVVRRVAAKRGSLPETPARILREMKSVTLFTDQAP